MVTSAISLKEVRDNLSGNNAKAKNAIIFGLSKSKLVKFMHCNSTKEVCMKINASHEGDEKVKKAKIQTLKMRFEIFKMSEEGSIEEYFLRVDELTNMIRVLGEDSRNI